MNLFLHAADSLKCGFARMAKHPARWLLFSVLTLIPVANFFVSGALLKIYRHEEPTLAEPKKCFVQGFFSVIINAIYMIIPLIIIFVFLLSGLLVGGETGDISGLLEGLLYGAVLGLGFAAIPAVFFSMVAIPAIINYARAKSIIAAFNFYEIPDLIRALGWGRYFLSWIVIIVCNLLISVLYLVVGLIPGVGFILSALVWFVCLVPVSVFNNTYWAKLL